MGFKGALKNTVAVDNLIQRVGMFLLFFYDYYYSSASHYVPGTWEKTFCCDYIITFWLDPFSLNKTAGFLPFCPLDCRPVAAFMQISIHMRMQLAEKYIQFALFFMKSLWLYGDYFL